MLPDFDNAKKMLTRLGRFNLSDGITDIINKYAYTPGPAYYYNSYLNGELEFYIAHNYRTVNSLLNIDFDTERVKLIIFDVLTTLVFDNDCESLSIADTLDVLLLAILLGLKYRYDDKINYLLDLLVVMFLVDCHSSGIADFWVYAYDLDDLYGNASIDYWSGQEITYLDITDLGKLIDTIKI